jgi:endonuclease YncB( thermonuclease family)
VRLLAGWLLALAAGSAVAASFEGVVTLVSDGDTLWVRPRHGGPPRSVRLAGIDAPELCQPHGMRSRESLARLVLHRDVRVEAERRDDYGRLLARVELHGRDVGATHVREGHAWSYRFRRDRGPYAREEHAARKSRRGLWQDAAPVEPRQFRRTHGPC